MPNITASTKINGTFLTVWKLMLDKIEHPNNYSPGIQGVKILENTADGIVREITVESGPIRDKVTWSEKTGTVRYEIQQHPKYTGFATDVVSRGNNPMETNLTTEIHWNGEDSGDAQQNFQKYADASLEHIKQIAEHMSGTKAAPGQS